MAAKGVPKKHYTGEIKQQVVETMQTEKLSYREAARRFGVLDSNSVVQWERIYLKEGPEGLYAKRKSNNNDTHEIRKPKLGKKGEEDLIAEVERLRAENDYLKKLNALVTQRVQREKKYK
jgi:transposase-like protein